MLHKLYELNPSKLAMHILKIIGVGLFFNFLSFVCGARGTFSRTNDDTFQMLIAGGIIPKHGKYVRHLVSIRTRNFIKFHGDNHFCTGVVTSSRTVLTAAHCVTDKHKTPMLARLLMVVFDTVYRLEQYEERQTRQVVQIFVHPNYTRYVKYDVAILQLSSRIEANMLNVKPIVRRHRPHLKDGDQCVTLGWGQVYQHGPYANELMYLEVTIRSENFCADQDHFSVWHSICTEPLGEGKVCAGDMGGPLICNDNLEGIIGGGQGCENIKSLKFTRFGRVAKWVADTVTKLSANRCKLSLILSIVCLQHLVY